MKKKFIILLLIALAIADTVKAQYSMGNRGMLNTPSAEMNEPGTFVIGGNFLPKGIVPFGYNTGNYFAGITLFSFLEITYRETLLKSTYMTTKPKFRQQDRSLSVRLRILKEHKYLPAIAIGTHDPFADLGRNYYQGYFGVMTKHFGIGNNEFGVNLGYICKTGDYNRLNDGVFGGITFRPSFYHDLTFIAEYDTRNFNLGAAVRLWKHLSIHAFACGFDCFSGGLRYECTLIH